MKKVLFKSTFAHGSGKLFELDGYTAQLCTTIESLYVAYALRYRCYRRNESIPSNSSMLFSDRYDELINTRTHLIWYEGNPIATVRSNVWSATYDWMPVECVETFHQAVSQKPGLKENMLESSRFAVVPEIKGRQSLFVQLLLFRIQDLSSRMDQCPFILTAVREKHVPFYQRMLSFEQISEPVHHDLVDANIVLLMTTQEESRATVLAKGMPPVSEEEVTIYKEQFLKLNTLQS